MQPQSVEEITQNLLNQMSYSYIQTDNVMVKYIFSFISISIMGYLTTRLPEWIKKIRAFCQKKESKAAFEYPTLKFAFSKKTTSYSLYSTNAVNAWLQKIKNCKSETIRTVRSVQNRQEETWIPEQSAPILVDDENDIYAQLNSQEGGGNGGGDDGGGGGEPKSAPKLEMFSLKIYTTSQNLEFLYKYHDDLVKQYLQKQRSRYEEEPHIFRFKKYNEWDGADWEAQKFSSSRTMNHIWFEEKNLFMKSYNYFLQNKDLYDKRGDPYTFSMLLYGPPGCGKTSLLKALINYDIKQRNKVSHLFVVPFSKITSIDIFENIMLDEYVNRCKIDMSRRIYVFEDFDATSAADVFNIRKSLKDLKKKEEAKKKKELKRIKGLKEKQKMEAEECKNESENSKEDLVETLKNWWKNEVELEQYTEDCMKSGYENMKYIYAIKGDDGKIDKLVSAVGIEKEGHMMMVKEKLKELNKKMMDAEEKKKQLEEKREKERNALKKEEKQLKELLFGEDKKDGDSDDEMDGGERSFKAWKFLRLKRIKGKAGGDSGSGSVDFNLSELNLSDILNILDGIVERTGQRCIWTTNKAPPQKYFDPAFLRPGRMDMIIKLGPCTLDGIEYLLKTYYEIDGDIDGKVEEKESIDVLNLEEVEERRFTPAQVKQICKENMECDGAIAMMRKLCHPDDGDEKEREIELQGLAIPKEKITRSHSGHWFDPNLDPFDETELVDAPSKTVSIKN